MESYKIAIFLRNFDKLLIFIYLSFFYLQFIFLGFYFHKKKIINKYLIIPFSFVFSSFIFGILNYLANFFKLKSDFASYILLIVTLFFYLINIFYFFKNFSDIKVKVINLLSNKFFYLVLFFLFFIFLAFFGIKAFPAGDAVFHISKINFQLNNGFSFNSNFNLDLKEIGYPLNSTHFILTIVVFLTKISPYSVWSFSLVFFTLIFFLSLVGFFFWLLKDEKKGFFLGILFFLMRDTISFSTAPYPNNQHIIASFFIFISLYNFFFHNNKLETIIFMILSFLGYQFIHISESAVLSIFIASSLLAFIFIKIFFEKENLKKYFSFIFSIKKLSLLFIICLPIFFHSIYVIKNFDYSQMTKINDKTDPFIINLYSIYKNFDLKDKINFYFKDLVIVDNLNEFFFLKGFFVHFLLIFILIAFALKDKNRQILYLSLFVLFTNVFVFNLGFITQKILPLWLMMRIDYFTYYIIFITVFYLINFLFERITDKRKASFLILSFLFFLVTSIFPRIQQVREDLRQINRGYTECEFFWKKVSDRVKLNGKIYVFEGCEEPQYYLNVLTLNSRYETEEEQSFKKELDRNFRSKKPKPVTDFKNLVDYVVLRNCDNSNFDSYIKIIKNKESYLFPQKDLRFCVFKI